MSQSDLENRIRAQVESFVAELSALIRESALQAVGDALGGAPGAAAPAGRGAFTRRKKVGKAAQKRAKKKGGRRARRSTEDLEAAGADLLEFIRANPDLRLEQIAATLGTTTAELRQPLQHMLSAGRLRTEGQARGTRYFVGDGTRRKAGGRKKKGGKRRKKAARRKRVTKK